MTIHRHIEGVLVRSSIIGLTLLLLAFLLAGCITFKKQPIPSQNIVYYIMTPFGPAPVVMEKGFLDEENKNDEWMTEEDFYKLMEESVTPYDEEGKADPIEHTIPFSLEL